MFHNQSRTKLEFSFKLLCFSCPFNSERNSDNTTRVFIPIINEFFWRLSILIIINIFNRMVWEYHFPNTTRAGLIWEIYLLLHASSDRGRVNTAFPYPWWLRLMCPVWHWIDYSAPTATTQKKACWSCADRLQMVLGMRVDFKLPNLKQFPK